MKDLAKAEFSQTDVTIVTDTEKAIISIKADGVRNGQHLLLMAWCQLTTGTDTTSVKPLIREGIGITGTIIVDVFSETIKIAAGGKEPFFIMCTTIAFQDEPDYVFTLKQNDASGNGTVNQACIVARRIG